MTKLERHIGLHNAKEDAAISPDAYVDIEAEYRGIARVDVSRFKNPTFYFEALLRSVEGTSYARLYNITDGVVVANSEVSTNSAIYVRQRSISITLTGTKEYKVQIKGAFVYLNSARLIVVQNLGTEQATVDEAQISILTDAAPLTGTGVWTRCNFCRLYYHEAAKWDGALTVYFEQTFYSMSSSKTVKARLYDETLGDFVANSEISTNSTTPVRVRSSAITLVDGHLYSIWHETAFTIEYIGMSKLIIQVSDAGGIDKGQCQVIVNNGVRQLRDEVIWQRECVQMLLIEANLPPRSYYFQTTAYGQLGHASEFDLFNIDTDLAVANSQLSFNEASPTRKRSIALALIDVDEYDSRFKNPAVTPWGYIVSCEMIIDVDMSGLSPPPPPPVPEKPLISPPLIQDPQVAKPIIRMQHSNVSGCILFSQGRPTLHQDCAT